MDKDEKILLNWKQANEEFYASYKKNLEEILSKPFSSWVTETIMHKDSPLLLIGNIFIATMNNNDAFLENLYHKAIDNGDEKASGFFYYILMDGGLQRILDAFKRICNEPEISEIANYLMEYRKFQKKNKRLEVKNISNRSMSYLFLRRWHYDHPKEYADFLSIFHKAYEGDMTFFNNNFFFLIEMLSSDGTQNVMKIVSSFIPDNAEYLQRLISPKGNTLKQQLAEILETSINNDAFREHLMQKNPYLFSCFYWMVFDNGFLHTADLLAHQFLKPDNANWIKQIGSNNLEALITASIDKAKYSKIQWKNFANKQKKGEYKTIINSILLDANSNRGRKATIVLLEEMLQPEYVQVLTTEIGKILNDWKQYSETDTILPCILAALTNIKLTNGKYNYRTFHNAIREKFPEIHVNKGYDWSEAVYNAIISEKITNDISEEVIERCQKLEKHIEFRLRSLITPAIK